MAYVTMVGIRGFCRVHVGVGGPPSFLSDCYKRLSGLEEETVVTGEDNVPIAESTIIAHGTVRILRKDRITEDARIVESLIKGEHI